MVTTITSAVVRSVCSRHVERLVPLAGGGMNETYRAELGGGTAVVVRIARHGTPWFVDEAQLMAQARDAGVPTAEVLGVEHVDHDGELLSFSIQQFLPGRSLAELVHRLTVADLERLVVDAGEILARVHSVAPGTGIRHELRLPEDREVARIAQTVADTLNPAAAAVIERSAELLRQVVTTHPAPTFALAQGDFLPKNLLVHNGKITGTLDWEFAGPAPAAFDLARWEVSAGAPFDDRLDLLGRGYARITDPSAAAAGLIAAYAIDWTLELLAWKNPAPPAQFQRCVDVLTRYLSP
jgi:aminoglycoside phosphotransferase (APT) family kinase protein